MERFLVFLIVMVLSGCATILASQQDRLFGAMDVVVKTLCKVKEADRLPLRQAIAERYGVDTSSLCSHVKARPGNSRSHTP